MSMPNPLERHVLRCGLAFLVSACQLSVDEHLVRDLPEDADAEVVCPEGYVCTPRDGGEEDPDASLELEEAGRNRDSARRVRLDGSQPSPVDGDSGQTQPPDAAPVVACNEDGHCGSDDFCSLGGSCEPRCNEQRGCLIANTGRLVVTSMMRIPDGVLYATQTKWDRFGNKLFDGSIWLLKQNGTSTQLVTGLDYGKLKLVADGQIYLAQLDHDAHGNEVDLHQVPLAGGSLQPVQVAGAGVRIVVASAGYLWWARVASPPSDTFELWRRARSPGAQDEKVKDVRGQALLAATDSSVYYVYDQPTLLKSDLMVDELNGATPRLISRADFTWNEATLFKDRVVGSTWYGQPVRWLSAPLSGGGQTLNILSSPENSQSDGATLLAYDEPWVYWSQAYSNGDNQWRLRLGRSHATLAFEPEELADFPARESAQFAPAPWPDELVYYTPSEQRLFRLPIPAPRCSDTVACPAGKTCQPDKTCH